MSNKLRIMVSLFIVSFLVSCNTDKDDNTVLQSDVLQILVRDDGAPGMYLNDDGKVYGFYVDLEKMVMDEMDQNYNFVPYSDVVQAINGLIDGTYHSALATPDLDNFKEFLYLSMSYEVLDFTTFVKKGNNFITGTTKEEVINSLKGKKVGVQAQGHIYHALQGYPEIEIIEYPTTTRALEDLGQEIIDAVPDVKRIGIYYDNLKSLNIEPVGDPIHTENVTTGFSKIYNKSLVNRYNKALREIIKDGRFADLYASYYGDS